jgi:DNA-binding XRE family transcriptional regulator
MNNQKVLTRKNEVTDELKESVKEIYKGISLVYDEFYYLDYEVDEDTGRINKDKKVRHYTKNQVERNLKALKSAYLIAQGAADPIEIISFRKKYDIPASILSLILGFSKNTISNIENEGITSLPSGRLIKICLSNRDIITNYIKMCNSIDEHKKTELMTKLSQS